METVLACSNCPAAFSSTGPPDLLVRFYYAPVVRFAAGGNEALPEPNMLEAAA